MHTTTGPHPGGVFRLGTQEVARIGYGAMQLTPHGAPPIPEQLGAELLRRAAELGVDHIDTAQFYGAGRANELIRAALHPYPAGLVLATKVGARVEGGRLVAAQQPAELRAQVEENLRTLGAERIAVVNLRRLDAPPGILAEGDQRVDTDAHSATSCSRVSGTVPPRAVDITRARRSGARQGIRGCRRPSGRAAGRASSPTRRAAGPRRCRRS